MTRPPTTPGKSGSPAWSDRPSLSGFRVCVTGGAGFIGSHLVDALVSAGAEVSVIDDFSHGRESNLAASAGRIRVTRGSILDDGALDRAMSGARVVFHLAALASVPESVANPLLYHAVNSGGTLRVLVAAHRLGARRVIYSASSSAYGDGPGQPKHEGMRPEPCSPYAATKLAGEDLLRASSKCFDLETISLRYFNIFGPRQRFDSAYAAVIPRWMHAMRAGEPVVIFGDGRQTRDFTHVANAVHANLLAAAAPADALRGAAVNVASGRSITLLELLAALEAQLGVRSRREHRPAQPGDIRESEASILAAKSLIGYEPVVAFEEGLAATATATVEAESNDAPSIEARRA